MQWMSPCLLLWTRMSSETLEEEDKWTQEDVQKISSSIFRLTHLFLLLSAWYVHASNVVPLWDSVLANNVFVSALDP